MTNTNEATIPVQDNTLELTPGQTLSAAAALLVAALVGFLKGLVLCGLLNLIPILPAHKRSQFSIMNRTFAVFVFGPIAAFILAAFSLLFVPVYRRTVAPLCERSCAWYAKKDLAF